MKRVIYLIPILLCFTSSTYAQNNSSSTFERRHNYTGNEKGFYTGINPFAIPASFHLKDDIKRFIPVFTGVEYGLSLSGGYFFNSHHALESRISLGNIHQFAFVGQLHLGTNYFVFDKLKISDNGFYLGGFFKFWDYYNKLTGKYFFNIVPYFTIGYWHEHEAIILDLRFNQTVAILSWSNLEHTSLGTDWFFSPWPAFIPILPTVTFNLGYRF